MIIKEILYSRLINQQIIQPTIKDIGEIVEWFCGMQAQDYISAKWAIGIRISGTSDQMVEQAIAERKIIRSWIMRGTLHMASASDIRWLLNLLAPRIIKAGAGRNRQLELDEATFKKSNNMLCRALEGGKELSRNELATILEDAGITTTGQRLPHLLQRAALEKLICFGSRKNKEFTFVLMDDFVPRTKPKTHDEALAEMAKRYFLSRGPATLQDFVWWSGLTKNDAQKGLESVRSFLQQETINGQEYILPEDIQSGKNNSGTTFLLPAFDEYVIAYKDRSALLNPGLSKQVISVNGIFYPVILVDGKVAGTWKRTFKKDKVQIEIKPFKPLNKTEQQQMLDCAGGFGIFAGKEVVY